MRAGHAHRAHRRAEPQTLVGTATAGTTLTVGVHASVVAGDYGVFATSHDGGTNIVPGSGTEFASQISTSQVTLTLKTPLSGSGDTIVYSGPASIRRLQSWVFRPTRIGTGASFATTATGTATTATIPALTVQWPNSTIIIVACAAKTGLTFSGSFTHDGTLTEVSNSNTNHSSYFASIINTSKFSGGTLSWDGTSLLHNAALCVLR